MKILFAASEAAPFMKTGGLGDVAGALPQALNSLGEDCRVIIPYYGDIPEAYKRTMTYIGNVYVPLSWRYQYCGVFAQAINGVKYYFIDNEYYFKRNGCYGHYDDAERFAFFSKAILEVLPLIDFIPDVIHANDWHTALVPVYLDVFHRDRKEYSGIRTVFTIHNIEFQGKYGRELYNNVIGMPPNKTSLIDYCGCCNFMKGGIETASVVTTVSKTYANEILDPYFSYGLDAILRNRSYKLRGVVNGIDTVTYNPKRDAALFKKFDLATIEDKEINKKGLCELLNLPYKEGRPMLAMITRLTEQKGMDLLAAVMDELLAFDLQLVILGTGDWKYETMLKEYGDRYPGKLKAIISFSNDLAKKIYGGADMFLMPSKFEPCGLSQMIAMRYGTVPIVRETGGLKDTVEPFNPSAGTGTGFNFYSYNALDMLGAVRRALCEYGKKANWSKLIANDMNKDFSWTKSAKEYVDIYKEII